MQVLTMAPSARMQELARPLLPPPSCMQVLTMAPSARMQELARPLLPPP